MAFPFLDIHLRDPLGAVRPNSGDHGNTKTMNLGGVQRNRVSSQSFKRHLEDVPPERDYNEAAVTVDIEPPPGGADPLRDGDGLPRSAAAGRRPLLRRT